MIGSRSGFPQNPHKMQGGWINLAISAAAALFGAKSKSKASKQSNNDRARELALQEKGLALSEKQDARSQQLFDEYKNTYMPRERALVEEAFGNELSPARAEARATTDVRDALGNARAISDREMARRGVDPTSGNAVALERATALGGAKMEAGLRTRAREGTRDKNFARQLDALSVGRGLPAVSSGMAGQAMQGVSNVTDLAAARSRYSDRLAFDAASDFGASIAELGAEAYDLYKGRQTKPSTPAGRGGSWG